MIEPTTTEAREMKKQLAYALKNLIADFETRTGLILTAINVERSEHKTYGFDGYGRVSILKGVYIATDL